MAYSRMAICIDCGKGFEQRTISQIRCGECQEKHRKENDRIRHRKLREEKPKAKAKGCRVMKQCYYGSATGCSYSLVTGHTRMSQGLRIVDGKCDAFTTRANKRRTIQEIPTYVPDKHGHNFCEV